MKTRIEAFIERLALGSSIGEHNHNNDGLDELSRMLELNGQHELAKRVYALYVEAFMIHTEISHRKEEENAVETIANLELTPSRTLGPWVQQYGRATRKRSNDS